MMENKPQQEILDYLNSQRIAVLAVQMLDNSPHAATVHFAHIEQPLSLIFMTNRNYRKCEPVLKNQSAQASVVVGFDETAMKTLQLDGQLNLLTDQAKIDLYFDKYPNKLEKQNPKEDIFLEFKPAWYRFTDFKGPKGKIIITS